MTAPQPPGLCWFPGLLCVWVHSIAVQFHDSAPGVFHTHHSPASRERPPPSRPTPYAPAHRHISNTDRREEPEQGMLPDPQPTHRGRPSPPPRKTRSRVRACNKWGKIFPQTGKAQKSTARLQPPLELTGRPCNLQTADPGIRWRPTEQSGHPGLPPAAILTHVHVNTYTREHGDT